MTTGSLFERSVTSTSEISAASPVIPSERFVMPGQAAETQTAWFKMMRGSDLWKDPLWAALIIIALFPAF